jgi:hypothetical protein
MRRKETHPESARIRDRDSRLTAFRRTLLCAKKRAPRVAGQFTTEEVRERKRQRKNSVSDVTKQIPCQFTRNRKCPEKTMANDFPS